MNYLDKAEKAIQYLADSEEEYARLKAGHQAEKERMKVIKASLMMESGESTQKGKEIDAESHEDYKDALTDWQTFMEEYYLVEAKRKRAELTIEMYRSVNSALKRGNI